MTVELLEGYERSLAFTALLNRTEWFGPMTVTRGSREITRLLDRWHAIPVTERRNITLYELAASQQPEDPAPGSPEGEGQCGKACRLFFEPQ